MINIITTIGLFHCSVFVIAYGMADTHLLETEMPLDCRATAVAANGLRPERKALATYAAPNDTPIYISVGQAVTLYTLDIYLFTVVGFFLSFHL